jgi:PhnB protein
MSGKVNPIPEGCHTVTPHLIVNDASAAIAFYKKALGAEELMRMEGPGGSIMHAEIKIGNSKIFLAGEFPQMGSLSPITLKGSPVVIHLYVDNVDAAYNRAVAAGATATMPVTDMFWGDRFGAFVDPYGHKWSVATRIKDMTPAECAKACQEAMSKMGKPCG